ncbi:MAG: heavy-metal-associated domain-containing protein [Nitrospinota bacterium]|nr:heavy-metal-associated domain-containing protein [Nitrospinota bacterium]
MKKTIDIEGMTCGHCVMHVTKALEGLDGVSGVKVDLEGKKASVTVNPQITDAVLQQAVSDAGYTATNISDGE